jgi:hypothetical protein
MIKIRYRSSNELSPGLHATAERDGRTTTVYLLSGMTAAQRRSALRRLRLTARMGHCPPLPAAQLGFALFTDRIRTGFGRAGAVLRLHPAGSTVPIMMLSGGAIAFLLFSTVSIHVLPTPRTAGPPVAPASAIAIDGGAPNQATGLGSPGNNQNPGDPGGSWDPADPSGLSRGSGARQLTEPSRSAATAWAVLAVGGLDTGTSSGSGSAGSGSAGSGSAGSGSAGSGGGGSGSDARGNSGKSSASGTAGGTTLSGGADAAQATPQQTTPATSAQAPAPENTSPANTTPANTTPANTTPATPPSSSGTSSSSSPGGVCVNVGPLGVCLDI